jgi:hypothetical protein
VTLEFAERLRLAQALGKRTFAVALPVFAFRPSFDCLDRDRYLPSSMQLGNAEARPPAILRAYAILPD